MKLPVEVRERFRRYGAIGGKTRALRTDAATRKRIACHAITTRWIRARFGAGTFAELGLPGGEVVDQGLADLAAERATIESLLVSLAEPRLRREGVPIGSVEANPERRLYALLERSEGDRAHQRYSAHLRRMVSFADACHVVRLGGPRA